MINTITYFVSTILTYVLGLLSKKFKWNEELPIPLQNCLVAIVVFAIAILYMWLANKPIEMNTLFEQIMVAIGGTGSATLLYDVKNK